MGHRVRFAMQKSAVFSWESAHHALAEARCLIEKHGYWRRKEEVKAAKAAITRV